MQKPLPKECNPYFLRYIKLVPEGNYNSLLNSNTNETLSFFALIPQEKHNYKYAPDKWTVKEVLQHITDTERVMSYRALAALRGDTNSMLPSMDENSYAAHADVSNRDMEDMLTEFKAIRMGTRKLLETVTEEQSIRKANIAGHSTTTRALAYVMIGHVMHHLDVTKKRYL